MEKKAKKSRLAGVPAWALSVLTLVATIAYLVIASDLGMKRELAGQSSIYIGPVRLIDITDFVVYVVLIPISCFLICRIHPKSIWYALVISNFVGFGLGCILIIDAVSDPDLWPELSDLIIWVGNWVLSITGAIVGARMGHRSIKQTT
jgi:hypothetical protein